VRQLAINYTARRMSAMRPANPRRRSASFGLPADDRICFADRFGLPLPQIPDGEADIISILIVLGTIVVAFFVLRSLNNRPAMGQPDSSIEDVLPPITNFDRLAILKQTLKQNLDQIDIATRWNDSNFVPLEAEV
jgi:hypothetical protein